MTRTAQASRPAASRFAASIATRRRPWPRASAVGNVLWFVLAGVWIAIGHLLTAIPLALTIIGIPLAVANVKLAAVALAPLGKEIVDRNDPRAAAGALF